VRSFIAWLHALALGLGGPGLFVVAFFLRRVTATPVLLAALVAQATVLALFFASDIGFLWYNVIGCATVVGVSVLTEVVRRQWRGAR